MEKNGYNHVSDGHDRYDTIYDEDHHGFHKEGSYSDDEKKADNRNILFKMMIMMMVMTTILTLPIITLTMLVEKLISSMLP